MAATSTNKQPLLVDHVLHEVVDLAGATVANGGGVDIGGTNNAVLVIDSTSADGCIVECVYAVSRSETYTIKLFLSSANDYLRSQQGVYIGEFEATASGAGTLTQWENMPSILAPVPATGTASQFKALYIPKGKALWAAVEGTGPNDQAINAPLLGVQGGWY
jgi:hypothetical protein